MLVQDIRQQPSVDEALAFKVHFPPIGSLGERLLVSALGHVPTSGWSQPRLSQRFYTVAPTNGIQDFDFYADPPHGPVLEVIMPIAAAGTFHCPKWAKAVRVHGAGDKYIEIALDKLLEERPMPQLEPLAPVREDHVIVRQTLAVFDDSFQPTGMCGLFHIRMKKLRHELVLTVTGPDEARIRHCINQAAAAGLIAAIVAAYATGGLGLSAAVGAFTSALEACLAGEYHVRIDNNSHWIEWCT